MVEWFIVVCDADGTSAVLLESKSDLKRVDSGSCSRHTLLDRTAIDERVFSVTFDKDDTAVQSKKPTNTHSEFSFCCGDDHSACCKLMTGCLMLTD